VVSFTPDLFTLGEKAPGTHSIGGWVGSRAGLEAGLVPPIIQPSDDFNELKPDFHFLLFGPNIAFHCFAEHFTFNESVLELTLRIFGNPEHWQHFPLCFI
jgi:hypothetical protein